jgi:glycosyltransferase involved in cell wall biosynthesis
VHHVAIKPVIYGTIAAKMAGKPKIINALAGLGWFVKESRGWRNLIKKWFSKVLINIIRNETVIVQNRDDKIYLVSRGVEAERVRLIHGAGVDLEDYQFRIAPGGRPVVVLPARLLRAKGVGEFVAAARLLRMRKTLARFVLAGNPDPENTDSVSQAEIAEWVKEGVVEHMGWVNDMPSLLAESSIVCLPSYYGEGIPKALIEAAACGRPIVTTNMPGCREAVIDGESGLLVPPRDAEAVAEAIEALIENPRRCEEMGRKGRKFAEGKFGIKLIIEQTLTAYGVPADMIGTP